MPNRVLDTVAVLSAIVLAYATFGHFYRYSIDEQLRAWHDGVQNFDYDAHPSDTFDPALYEDIRSVDDAVRHIRALAANGGGASEEERLRIAYDVVRSRFMHFMYPHHTFITNPVLSLLEVLFPKRSYNTMALADMKLRHAAAVECGGAATTFVEVYRALGGRAQYVTYPGPPGHQIAEAEVNGRKYLVDTDLEVLAPYGVLEFGRRSELVEQYYAHRSADEIEVYRDVYAQPPQLGGYDGPPTSSPRAYIAQSVLERAKFAGPMVLLAICLVLRFRNARAESGGA